MSEALWALGRGTGVVALVMLTLALTLGVASRSGRGLGLGRFGVQEVHRTAALTGTGLIVLHVGALMLDPYAQLHLVDAVVPFLARYRPLWLGLGTLGLDLLLVVVVVSLLRGRLGPRVFTVVHRATYALWPLALGHAIGAGSDGHSGWLLATAGCCVAAVLLAVTWRLLPSYAERGQVRRPRRPAYQPEGGAR